MTPEDIHALLRPFLFLSLGIGLYIALRLLVWWWSHRPKKHCLHSRMDHELLTCPDCGTTARELALRRGPAPHSNNCKCGKCAGFGGADRRAAAKE